MRRLFRIAGLVSIIILSIVAALVLVSVLLRDRVTSSAINLLNQNISVRLETAKTRLTFLKNFPRASVELYDVIIHSSTGLRRSDFVDIQTDTLLKADLIAVDFNISQLLKKVYVLEGISVKHGRLTLLSDSMGVVNYEINRSVKSEVSPGDFTVSLEKILFDDMNVEYYNAASAIRTGGQLTNCRLKSVFSLRDIDFSADGNISLEQLSIKNFLLNDTLEASVSLRIINEPGGIDIRYGSISLDGYRFNVDGIISSADSIDLNFDGSEIDLAALISYLPAELRQRISDYRPGGTLSVKGNLKGPLSKNEVPCLSFGFSLSNSTVAYAGSELEFTGLALLGTFISQSEAMNSAGSLSIDHFEGRMGSGNYTGALKVTSFDSPEYTLELSGDLYPAEIIRFFSFPAISNASGNAKFNFSLHGNHKLSERITPEVILDMNPVINADFNSLSLELSKNNISIENISGGFELREGNAMVSDFGFRFREHEVKIAGEFGNLSGWIADSSQTMTIVGSVACRKLEPVLLAAPKGNEPGTGRDSDIFSKNIIADIQFSIGSFISSTFSATDILGSLSYKPALINIKTLKMNTLSGILSGSAFFYRNDDHSFISKSQISLENIDVTSAFSSFRNFGQDFIKSENLSGSLSGEISMLLPFDTLFKPVVKSLTAEGNFTLTNGSLVNFEPVKALSKFIELSELEKISFDELRNDFYIRNNAITIPEMEVKSSAANLSVSGRHGFDNKYEYHIRILLSEILSRKVRKPRQGNTEFGAVQDDGLGRTSLLLRVEDKGSGLKVSYDAKAAGSEIKKDIKTERQTLKSILNEEYGWFRNDSTVSKVPETKNQPKFRITWEEADSTGADTITIPVNKDKPLKNLFRKRVPQ